MTKKENGLFVLYELIKTLKHRVESDDPVRKENIKVAKERAKASAMTLFYLQLLSINERDVIDSYINGLVEGTLTEELRLKTFNIFEDMIKESEVQ